MTSVGDLLMSEIIVRGVDTSIPPYKRLQAAWREWDALGDKYVSRVVQNGLLFDWVPGFNLLHPEDNYRPFSLAPHARDISDEDVVLRQEVEKLVLAGHVSEIDPEEAKCVTSIFLVDKKHDPENPEGSSRPCTNLKPVNRFIHVTYFTLPTLSEEGILRMQTGFEIGLFSHADCEERCIMVVFPTQRMRVSLELFTFWS